MSTRADLEVAITKTPVLAALDRAGVPRRDDHGRPINPSVRIGVLAAERDELREEAEQLREALRQIRDHGTENGHECWAIHRGDCADVFQEIARAALPASDHRATPDQPGNHQREKTR